MVPPQTVKDRFFASLLYPALPTFVKGVVPYCVNRLGFTTIRACAGSTGGAPTTGFLVSVPDVPRAGARP